MHRAHRTRVIANARRANDQLQLRLQTINERRTKRPNDTAVRFTKTLIQNNARKCLFLQGDDRRHFIVELATAQTETRTIKLKHLCREINTTRD